MGRNNRALLLKTIHFCSMPTLHEKCFLPVEFGRIGWFFATSPSISCEIHPFIHALRECNCRSVDCVARSLAEYYSDFQQADIYSTLKNKGSELGLWVLPWECQKKDANEFLQRRIANRKSENRLYGFNSGKGLLNAGSDLDTICTLEAKRLLDIMLSVNKEGYSIGTTSPISVVLLVKDKQLRY